MADPDFCSCCGILLHFLVLCISSKSYLFTLGRSEHLLLSGCFKKFFQVSQKKQVPYQHPVTGYLVFPWIHWSKKPVSLNTAKERKYPVVIKHILRILTGIPGFFPVVDAVARFLRSPESYVTQRRPFQAYFSAVEIKCPAMFSVVRPCSNSLHSGLCLD